MTNNILSHHCVSGRIYQQLGMQFKNPFMWCVIPPEDFYYLYNHYNEIDYKNIKLEKAGKDYKLTIGDKISIYYVHYKYDKDANVPIKKFKIDIFYNKIEDYILDRYYARLERMIDPPTYIVTDRIFMTKPECNFEKNDLLKYVDKDNCIVVTCDKTIAGKNVIYVPNKNLDPVDIAEIIIKELNLKK